MGARIEPTEIYKAGERLPVKRDPWAEKLAWLMDSAITVGRWSIGLDGIIGLVPGLGDIAGALISMLIVLRAAHAGIPRVAIARMVANIAIDTLVGSIPVFGDAFDFAYKSNIKNVRIYEEALNREQSAARHWGFFILLFAAIGLISAAVIFGLFALIRAIGHVL